MGRFLRTVKGTIRQQGLWLFAAGLVLAVNSGVNAGAAVTPPSLEVQASSREVIRFSVGNLEPVWDLKSLRDGTLKLYDVSLPGFFTSGPVGSPRVPVRGGWLIVPPGTRPEISVITEKWEPAGNRPLMVEMTPTIWQGAEGSDSGVSEILVLPGETVPDGVSVPAGALADLAKGSVSVTTALNLGEIGWWRGHRVVPFQLTGVLTDGRGLATSVLSGGTWEVRFVADRSLSAAGIPEQQRRRVTNRNDDHFSSAFLNAGLLKKLSTEASYMAVDLPTKSGAVAEIKKSGSLLGAETRLGVTRTTMHRVTYSRLRSRNLLPDVAIEESQIRLYQRRYVKELDDGSGTAPYIEIEVPILMMGEGDLFDGDDFFVFYGLRLRDDTEFNIDLGAGVMTVPGAGDPFEQSNDANVYWLAASEPETGTPWSRMDSYILPAAVGTPLANYRRNDHVEEQESFRENVYRIDVDRMYYNHLFARDVTAAINPLYSPDPTGSAVELKVGISGWNRLSRSLQFSLITGDQTTPLEDYVVTSPFETVRNYTLSPANIAGASARVRMTTNPEGGVTFSYLNWLEISYDALYKAAFNRLEFNSGVGVGARPVIVEDFSNSDLGLFEITDPRHPVHIPLSVDNVVAAGGTWNLSVMPNQADAQQREYYVSAGASDTGIAELSTVHATVAENAATPTDISSLPAGNTPDLIVVTHEDFREAIGRWVDHRIARSGGKLQVHVINVDDLYDWYSGGLKDAWAIKRFTHHAIGEWGSWALMIVGDANENMLEKELTGDSADWSADWVPTHYHIQDAGSQYNPELMASDKWYASYSAGANYPDDKFPYDISGPWDMYSGRFPCNSVAELNNMIDKVITVESPELGQTWRRNGIFFADDEWSNGLGATALTVLEYNPYTDGTFAKSEQDSLVVIWGERSAVSLNPVLVLLKPYMDDGFPGGQSYTIDRSLDDARDWAGIHATGPLLQSLSAGGIVSHYQGHANPYVLSSESWIEDRTLSVGRSDIGRLANIDKPWFFMGMGCHIADWAQNAVRINIVPNEPSLCEKMLSRAGAGASAVYGSSGFEYISPNRLFGEYIFRRWIDYPPTGPNGSIAGSSGRGRWITGELMWSSETDIMAVRGYAGSFPTNRNIYLEMVSQYVLLGDPLMILDAGEAEVTATLIGSPDQEVSGEIDLVAIDAQNKRTLTLVASDEAAIDRLVVVDNNGNDVTAQVEIVETLPVGATRHRTVNYELTVDVLPYDHQLTVQVFDTGAALPSDRRYELVLNMPQSAVFIADGAEIDPDDWVFQAEVPVEFTARVVSSALLNAGMAMSLESTTLSITQPVAFNITAEGDLDLVFTAQSSTTDDKQTHEVVLTIDGLETILVLQSGTGTTSVQGIGRVLNFPNPMADNTNFVFESGPSQGAGKIQIYSVAGQTVASIGFQYDGSGRAAVPWDGRDGRGDELGNGTYLYRVEIQSSLGPIVSEMQRLVVMR